MNNKIIVVFCLFFLLIFNVPSSHSISSNKIKVISLEGESISLYNDYYAVVVGVSNYDHWPLLPQAIDDAKMVSWFLLNRGFKVILLIDPTYQELKNNLDLLALKIGKEPDRGIFLYFSGHGETQVLADGSKLGYIIPRDCPVPEDNFLGFTQKAISTKDIEMYSAKILSKHVFMFFDASFTDTIFPFEPVILKIIDEKNTLPVRQYIITGRETKQNLVQYPFSQYLLDALKGEADFIHDGYITASEIAVYLLSKVGNNLNVKEKFHYGKIKNEALAEGDFVFVLKKTQLNKGRLFIETNPKESEIKILNIQPPFVQGMLLDPGKYHLLISKEEYSPWEDWITIEIENDKTICIKLDEINKKLFTNSLGMQFVLISSGSFNMGSSLTEKGREDDEQQHQVFLPKKYYIQKTEVTRGQFRKFILDSGYVTEAEKNGGCWVNTKDERWVKKMEYNWYNSANKDTESIESDNYPVNCISWNDAQEFINWLNSKEKMNYRLPTEAEWEYACRAGTDTPFSYGNCLSQNQENFGHLGPFFLECQGNFSNPNKMLTSVASLKPNPWGLFDMHGNLLEWCQDWYGPYPENSVNDPTGTPRGWERVLRGGHWLTEAHNCRSAKRWHLGPDYSADVIGFRLVTRDFKENK